MTKLAKLDFLLRYPAFTDTLLATRGVSWPIGAQPSVEEMEAVESRMIRFKYGPWDERYYVLLGTLVGCELAEVAKDRNSLTMRLTPAGMERAAEIASSREWQIVDLRAEMLKQHFDKSGSTLKKIIYQELPEVVNRPHRMEI
ncbi:hypothetical protein ACBI99_15075 [Nonomuraea sp. ATR24]|uniref:hypothetical protein n=1 Tax=Nonomuraea sp. ATR24 TaxID=1676744 RepID=UPI0035BFEB89